MYNVKMTYVIVTILFFPNNLLQYHKIFWTDLQNIYLNSLSLFFFWVVIHCKTGCIVSLEQLDPVITPDLICYKQKSF